MLELKNIEKIYNSKKGSSTKALTNINLKFDNTGIGFIIGSSGSGKSTLLNLIGGLDSPSSGNIIIDNKNISNFKDIEYDSYRNTYVGFIFQEFNILEQYSVYENIELAIKLQKKQIDQSYFVELLTNLGINELENRKINELSGGQKQRVAIARALIKNPKIILADEPTGNLDSKASSQIFDILKEISKNKLVIVVSHDEEAAKKYADRIIKIEDGEMISDSNNFLISTVADNYNLKKSKLPFNYGLKMAFNNLKSKPFKLLMTIILTSISLIFMGITVNCALFDSSTFISETVSSNKYYLLDIYKDNFNNINFDRMKLNTKDFKNINNSTNSIINKVYNLFDNGNGLNFQYGPSNEINKLAYFYQKPGDFVFDFVEVSDDKFYNNIIGSKPLKDNIPLII